MAKANFKVVEIDLDDDFESAPKRPAAAPNGTSATTQSQQRPPLRPPAAAPQPSVPLAISEPRSTRGPSASPSSAAPPTGGSASAASYTSLSAANATTEGQRKRTADEMQAAHASRPAQRTGAERLASHYPALRQQPSNAHAATQGTAEPNTAVNVTAARADQCLVPVDRAVHSADQHHTLERSVDSAVRRAVNYSVDRAVQRAVFHSVEHAIDRAVKRALESAASRAIAHAQETATSSGNVISEEHVPLHGLAPMAGASEGAALVAQAVVASAPSPSVPQALVPSPLPQTQQPCAEALGLARESVMTPPADEPVVAVAPHAQRQRLVGPALGIVGAVGVALGGFAVLGGAGAAVAAVCGYAAPALALAASL